MRWPWENTRGEEWKRRLTNYNLEDCAALKRVTGLVSAVTAVVNSGAQPGPTETEDLPVVRVQEVERWANNRNWGRVNFFHPDYAFINKCGYFDYQRERVYVRTSKTLEKNLARRTKRSRLKLRVSQHFRITSSRCPACGSHEVTTELKSSEVSCSVPRVKRAYDLVMTSGGMKRRVIECRSSVHQCLKCRHTFVPERHLRLDKHFHGLKSWAMYQHVAHSLSLGCPV